MLQEIKHVPRVPRCQFAKSRSTRKITNKNKRLLSTCRVRSLGRKGAKGARRSVCRARSGGDPHSRGEIKPPEFRSKGSETHSASRSISSGVGVSISRSSRKPYSEGYLSHYDTQDGTTCLVDDVAFAGAAKLEYESHCINLRIGIYMRETFHGLDKFSNQSPLTDLLIGRLRGVHFKSPRGVEPKAGRLGLQCPYHVVYDGSVFFCEHARDNPRRTYLVASCNHDRSSEEKSTLGRPHKSLMSHLRSTCSEMRAAAAWPRRSRLILDQGGLRIS
ncbi:hypothetical protein BHE74_00030948 [Ensete ventricosum]|nr:hypothetical protein BHE74_00030948 [Ensete ventricosum]